MSEAQPIEPIRRKGIMLGRRISPDDLQAEESRIIEENFPKHRTLQLKPNSGITPPGERVEIVVTEEVLLATAHHVAQDTTKESGGFLLGNQYVCPNTNRRYIVIDQYMKADYTEGTQVSLTFTTDSWAHLKDRLDGKFRGKKLVGWYHSHPAMGIFLSNYDLDIHKGNYFGQDWQVALVLDPVKHEGGFFGSVEGNVSPRDKLDFYELLEGDSRETVVAWTNYTAEDPKTKLPAALKTVNTQNSDGNPAAMVSTAPKTQTVKSGGLLSNPLVLIGGAAVLGLLLLATLFAGYWLFLRKPATTETNTTNNPAADKNKVLISKNIRISDELKGWVSSDNKITVDMQIKGIGSPDVIEQVSKDMIVEINDQPTTLIHEVVNGSILKVRAVAILPAEVVESFNSNKQQDFVMRVELSYNEDVVAKRIPTTFKKGSGNSAPSLGEAVVFGDNPVNNQNDDTPRQKKPVVTQRQTDDDKPRPQENDKPDKPNPVQSKPTQAKPKPTPKPKDKNGLESLQCKITGSC